MEDKERVSNQAVTSCSY